MTLRARLLAAFAIILATVVVGAVLLVRSQAAYLTELLDGQLAAAIGPVVRSPGPLFERDERLGQRFRFVMPVDPAQRETQPRPVAPGRSPVPGASAAPAATTQDPDAPISDLFLAIVHDGALRPLLRGQLLEDVPAPPADLATLEAAVNRGPVTLQGEAGTSRFRAMVVRPEGATATAVVALPMDTVDSAVDRLSLVLAGGIVLIALLLGLIVWWVERLGLRPIARLTATADALARGERDLRAQGADPRTEAGRLAGAFNLMLDERDEGELRLRRFVADASHELRTPLTSIRGYLELLGDSGSTDSTERADMVRRMSREALRMGDLVEDLLLLAQLDERRPLRREPVDLAQLLRDTAQDALVVQPDRAIRVVTADGPLTVPGDPLRLTQVITALVHNALVHTPVEAPITLGARVEADLAIVTVVDGGPGLSPALADRAFDRFVRGETSRSRRTGGAGLGLAIARAVVEAHGGTITLETSPGAGCRFTVALPAPPADSGSGSAEVVQDHDPGRDGRQVLVRLDQFR